MSEYIYDEKGKWKVQGISKMLVEPSESYNQARLAEHQAEEEQKKLDSLVPTQDEIRKAETEIQIINLLQEVGLI
ncbi:hypothetical protein [Abyssisolibacter fermentans]|uniref:hypothetical protein n=1 Tax=Abyssisolibacter fermentans TaxID=1766203 RepID=UPI0008329548|nr:hypothetical protein [Abyssisolibacter fermentans]